MQENHSKRHFKIFEGYFSAIYVIIKVPPPSHWVFPLKTLPPDIKHLPHPSYVQTLLIPIPQNGLTSLLNIKISNTSQIYQAVMYVPLCTSLRAYLMVGNAKLGVHKASLSPLEVALYTMRMSSPFGT